MKTTAMKVRRTTALLAALCVAAMLMAPAASFAQSSVKGYGGDGGEVQSNIASGGDQGSDVAASTDSGSDPVSGSGSGSLPFTGLDIGWMLGGAALLIGAGIVMGRSATRDAVQ